MTSSSLLKQKQQMERGFFNGQEQPLYYPDDHPVHPGWFKGMAQILTERGYDAVESQLEMFARGQGGFEIIFLLKFHCKLNYIEQCWGYAKQNYHLLPPSSSANVLKKNVMKVLAGIPLESMCQFSICALHFTYAYSKGLNSQQAAWAVRKYRGHYTIPNAILHELCN
ncbi:hypothetical protein P691DRAFT_794045 [Macrolepiota fuliginosa MF-IS2]|uniref:Uncharacterized protein n=1 Tax=Macrolepiota fuliginosa MF-IS2 TaxID=1400762 RepID=A0A9P5WWL2_9AGAR|nr:hypothetical protein P691DRAFT_794045 [Macrolepiota fuliginosa MF-IS2]